MATLLETPTPAPVINPGSLVPSHLKRSRPLFDREIVKRALRDSVLKLNPKTLLKNPVIFVVEMGAPLISVFLHHHFVEGAARRGCEFQIALWLWFTVLLTNFAEAMAEARGKAQADTLRDT